MKKAAAIILIICAMLTAMLTACTAAERNDPQGEAGDGSTSMETRQAVSDTQTMETKHEDWEDSDSFEDNCEPLSKLSQVERYTGKGTRIRSDEFGFLLTIPEEWAHDTMLVREYGNTFYLVNRDLYQKYKEVLREGGGGDDAGYWQDWILRIRAEKKQDVDTIRELDQLPILEYVGESGDYRLYAQGTDMRDLECDTFLTVRSLLIEKIGEAAYDEIVGDMVCGRERLHELIRVP